MKARTFMSTDWIEVHNRSSIYEARVFLTDEDEAYMEAVMEGKKRFFKVNASMLKLGKLGFFERVMESAKELPLERAFELGLMDRKGQ